MSLTANQMAELVSLISDPDADEDELNSIFEGVGRGNVNRAAGYVFLLESGAASRLSKSVKDFDLAVDLTKRAKDLRDTAAMYFSRADSEDFLDGAEEAFEIVPTGDDRFIHHRVEGFPYWPGLRS